jgi:alkanesulfonate monooxygenase SsuD/methylene tetrahydromethanopterin reductase-like flavin-dependent oxidoreductase (luciferase family)
VSARADVFRAAAADIREHGLSKIGFEAGGQRCTVGALIVAGGGDLNAEGLTRSINAVLPEVELVAQMLALSARVDADLDDPNFESFLRDALLRAVYRWNDGAATAEQVVDLFEKAADRLEAQQQAEADLFGGGLVVVP